MATYRDTSGVWRYRVTVTLPDGKPSRISGTPEVNTKSAALAEERAHILREKNPPHVKGPAAPAFDAYATDWLRRHTTLAQNRASSTAEKETHLRNHLIPFFGSTPIDEIDKPRILDLVEHLSHKKVSNHQVDKKSTKKKPPEDAGGRTLSPKTIRNILQNLARMLRSAKEWGRLAALPDFPKVKVPKSKFDFLTEGEALKLLAACRDDEDRLEFQFALDTGARVSEQMAIEWGDFDFTRHTVTIRRQLYKGVLGPTKTGGERTIPLTPALEALLQRVGAARQADEIEKTGRSKGYKADDRIFVDAEFGRSRTYSHFVGGMRRVRAAAKLRHLGWHGLRHSFASQLVMRGCPLMMVRDWLGHSTIKMTEKYSHLAPNSGADFLRRMERRAA